MPQQPRLSTRQVPAVLVFLTGAAALACEASWSRQLGLQLGFTEGAAAVVLAAWFMGNAMGARAARRWLQTPRHALRTWALTEITAGVWVLLLPWMLGLLDAPQNWLWENSAAPLRQAAQAPLVILALLPTTFALGFGLPCALAPASRSSARSPAWLYGFNLAGAAVGILATAFFLMLPLGVVGTSLWAGGLEIVCGITGLLLARRDAKTPPPPKSGQARSNRDLLWLAIVSGFVALAAEVIYLRLFSRVLHNSSYALALVVAVVIAALAFGSRSANRAQDPVAALQRALALGSLLLPLSALVFVFSTFFGRLHAQSFLNYITVCTIMTGLVLGPSMAVVGRILPLCLRVSPSPAGMADLLTLNGIAAGTGALIAAFVLLPLLGPMASLSALSLALLGAAALRAAPAQRRRLALFVIPILLVPTLPDSPAIVGTTVRASWETPYGLIEVVDAESDRMLVQDSSYIMGSRKGADFERNQAHLPLLLHPAPKRVLFLGLATGITATAALEHPNLEKIAAVERAPAILDAAALFADDHGPGGLAALEIQLDDARHAISRSDAGEWDVIVSDLFVPWHSRTGYLYTVEHYAALKAHLRPGGLVCQWISLTQVGAEELRILADTMASVFESLEIWQNPTARRVICLIGSVKPPAALDKRTEYRAARLPTGLRRGELQISRLHDLRKQRLGIWRLSRNPVLNTDEHPHIEFGAPRSAVAVNVTPDGHVEQLLKLLAEHR